MPFEECKVFILMPIAKYLGSDVGMKVFWSLKDLSMEKFIDYSGIRTMLYYSGHL